MLLSWLFGGPAFAREKFDVRTGLMFYCLTLVTAYYSGTYILIIAFIHILKFAVCTIIHSIMMKFRVNTKLVPSKVGFFGMLVCKLQSIYLRPLIRTEHRILLVFVFNVLVLLCASQI